MKFFILASQRGFLFGIKKVLYRLGEQIVKYYL